MLLSSNSASWKDNVGNNEVIVHWTPRDLPRINRLPRWRIRHMSIRVIMGWIMRRIWHWLIGRMICDIEDQICALLNTILLTLVSEDPHSFYVLIAEFFLVLHQKVAH
jgi:hypothetical protein